MRPSTSSAASSGGTRGRADGFRPGRFSRGPPRRRGPCPGGERNMPITQENAVRSCATREGTDVWLTPPEVLDPIRAMYTIVFDPCTEPSNPVGARVFCIAPWQRPPPGTALPPANGGGYLFNGDPLAPGGWVSTLEHDVVFVNPPYSGLPADWGTVIRREALAGRNIIALLPSRTDRAWFRSLWEVAHDVYFWPGRIRFLNGDGVRQGQAPYPSVLMGFNCVLPMFHAGGVGCGLYVRP